MQIANLATVSINTNGEVLITSAQATAAIQCGLDSVAINPSVDIVLVGQASQFAGIPGVVDGTVANSPLVCPAGAVTVVQHRSGPINAISTSGTATVKVALVCLP